MESVKSLTSNKSEDLNTLIEVGSLHSTDYFFDMEAQDSNLVSELNELK